MSTIKKTFDCIAFQRKRRAEIDADTEGMTFEEFQKYIQKGVAKLHETIRQINEKEKLASKAKVKQHH